MIAGWSAAEALLVAEQIREAIFILNIPNVRNGLFKIVSVSIGVCSMVPSASDTLASFVQRADQALYQAKHLGRNRVHAFDECSVNPDAAHPSDGMTEVPARTPDVRAPSGRAAARAGYLQ